MNSAALPIGRQAFCSAAVMMLAACGAETIDRIEVVRDGGNDLVVPERDGGTADAGNAQEERDGGTANVGLCPPMGPTGTTLGATLPNLALKTCDGEDFALHDICETRASHLFIMAGW